PASPTRAARATQPAPAKSATTQRANAPTRQAIAATQRTSRATQQTNATTQPAIAATQRTSRATQQAGATTQPAIAATQRTHQAERIRRPPRNGHARRPNSAKRHAERRPKSARSASASAAHPTTVPTRRIVRRTLDRRLHAVLTVVLIAFLAPVIASAHTPEALRQFEVGKQAVAAQDFASALDAFEAAAAAGMSGPAVHFNIGICAYRLGRWSRATSA